MNNKAQIIQSLEADIATYEALGQDVTERKRLLNKLKAQSDPIWQALGGDPSNHPLNK